MDGEEKFRREVATRLRKLADARFGDMKNADRANHLKMALQTFENFISETSPQVPGGIHLLNLAEGLGVTTDHILGRDTTESGGDDDVVYDHHTNTKVKIRASQWDRWSDTKAQALATIVDAGGKKKRPKRADKRIARRSVAVGE